MAADYSFLEKNRVVPVVVFNDLSEVVPKLTALDNGGIHAAEITFRTACAADAIRLAAEQFPQMAIGAGTVINAEQCEAAIEAGAQFIVSPGMAEDAAAVCSEYGIPYLPGCVTPSTSAFCRCFLKSMQKAIASFGGFFSFSPMFSLQFCACAHISSLTVPFAVYIKNVSSSFSGWLIRETFPPFKRSPSSFMTYLSVKASCGIAHLVNPFCAALLPPPKGNYTASGGKSKIICFPCAQNAFQNTTYVLKCVVLERGASILYGIADIIIV